MAYKPIGLTKVYHTPWEYEIPAVAKTVIEENESDLRDATCCDISFHRLKGRQVAVDIRE